MEGAEATAAAAADAAGGEAAGAAADAAAGAAADAAGGATADAAGGAAAKMSPTRGSLVLVTGGGGYVGSHCVKKLLEEGFRVRATVRDPTDKRNAFLKTLTPNAATDLELVACDLLRSDGWQEAVDGVEGILHVAAVFRNAQPKNENEILAPAVGGVERVLAEAAAAEGVKRIVVTSSCYAVIQSLKTSEIPPGKKFDEADWSLPELQTAYGKSKTLSEKRAWAIAKQWNLDLVTILPGLIIGRVLSEAQSKASESSKIVCDLMQRKNIALPKIGFPLCDVEDVAAAHVRALTLPREEVVGKRFIIAGVEGATMAEVGAMLRDEFRQYNWNPTTAEAPSWLVKFSALFLSEAAAISPLVGSTRPCSGERARTVLLDGNYRDCRNALKCHALSLMAFGVLPSKGVPKEQFEEYKSKASAAS